MKIKQLEWQVWHFLDEHGYKCDTAVCNYRIDYDYNHKKYNHVLMIKHTESNWYSLLGNFTNPENAKKKAQKHFESIIKQFLE